MYKALPVGTFFAEPLREQSVSVHPLFLVLSTCSSDFNSAVCLLRPVSAMGVALLEWWCCEQFVTSHDENPFESGDLWSVPSPKGKEVFVSAPVRNKKGRVGNVSTPGLLALKVPDLCQGKRRTTVVLRFRGACHSVVCRGDG